MPTPYTPTDLAQYLYQSCYGSVNGQSAGELVEALTNNRTTPAAERQLRQAITVLRERESYPICGTPETGYYYAASAAELTASLEFLRGRAMTSLRLMAKLRRRCLATLVGQGDLGLELPTLPPPPPVDRWNLVGCPIRLPREIFELVQGVTERPDSTESFSRFVAAALAQRLLVMGVELSPEMLSLIDKES